MKNRIEQTPEHLISSTLLTAHRSLKRRGKNRLITQARATRKEPTPAERLLWQDRRNTALGHQFRRPAPMGVHIVDFLGPALRLSIEVDGESHAETSADARRDA